MASSQPPALAPTLRLVDDHFFVGEQILFRVGVHAAAPVDALRLNALEGRLTVRAPDGRTAVEEFAAPATYDGPALAKGLSRLVCLNDLVPHLAEGRYQLAYACAGRVIEEGITLRAVPALERIAVEIDLPPRVDPGAERAIPVGVTVRNGGPSAIEIVAPGSNWFSGPAGYLEADAPALWARLAPSPIPPRELPIRQNRARLAMRTIAPGERSAAQVVLAAGSPYALPRGCAVTVGVVVLVFLPGIERAIGLLHRARARYGGDGARAEVTVGGPMPRWVLVAPER